MAQVVADLPRVSLLANPDIARLSVNFRRIGEDRAVKTLVDDLLILNIIVREDAEQNDANDQDSSHSGPQKRAPQAATKTFNAWNFDFDCHVPSGRSSPLLFISQDSWRARALPAGAEKFLPSLL